MIDYCNSNNEMPEWLFILHNKEENIKIPLVRGINIITSKELLGLSNFGFSDIVFKINIHSYERATLRVFDAFPVIIRIENEYFNEKILLNRSCVKTIQISENTEIQPINKDFPFAKFVLQKCVEEGITNPNRVNKTLSAELFSNSDLYLKSHSEDTCHDSSTSLNENAHSSHINVDKLNKLLEDKKYSVDSKTIVANMKRKRDNIKINTNATLCGICLDHMTSIAKIARCDHQFCVECLSNWARLSNNCPVCKKEFKKIGIWSQNMRRYEYMRVSYKKYRETESDEMIEGCMKNCMKCNKDEEVYLMLICNKCNYNVCHTYCDGLDRIPDGDWYCPQCRVRKCVASQRTQNIL